MSTPYEEATASLNPADMAYVACGTIGILVITPGIALFYGTKKSYLALAIQSYLITCLTFIQWYLFGFSLSNSTNASSSIIGNWKFGGLKGIGAGPLAEGGTIPIIESFVFLGFFQVCTVAIFLSSVQRARMIPSLVLGFTWSIVCYLPQSYWTWNSNGWLYKLGDLDTAGGGPVHVSSGIAALAYSLFIGKRKEWEEGGKSPKTIPYNPILNFLGCLLIYFPWLFFNSATVGTIQTTRTLYILANTQLAASFAMPTFVFIDYAFRKKWSLQACSEGIIVGLVFVTPACGYLEPWAIAIGSIVTAIVCRLTYDINDWIGIDDVVHSFNVHGIGGIMGSILVGLFASPTIASYDGVTEIKGGWIFHHWKQMGYQLAGSFAIAAWTFVMTYALCFIIDKIPGLKFRLDENEEEMGWDRTEVYEIQLLDEESDIAGLEFKGNVEVLQGSEDPSSSESNTRANNFSASGSYELQDIKS